MSASRTRHVVLVMRRSLATMPDHVQALRDLNIAVHLLTVDSEPWASDPRFATVTQLRADQPAEDFVGVAIELAKRHEARAVFTFMEPDIVIAETANHALNPEVALPEAAKICRNKQRQREFLARHGLPSVRFQGISGPLTPAGLPEKSIELPYPLIVKPTRAAASDMVKLVRDDGELARALAGIDQLVRSRRNFYYADDDEPWALVEEYLPGEEVTLDGVVVDGRFHLGGIHNKKRSDGPWFEEDLYTLPFLWPDLEPELSGIAQDLAAKLGARRSLINLELRQDRAGRFRIVEFSIRISGGHVYRHIRDVYGIDLVRIYTRAICGDTADEIWATEVPRLAPRMAVSAKVIYGRGTVVRNNAGGAGHSPHTRAYYAVAPPGAVVVAGDGGFDFVGLLSVWAPLVEHEHPADVHRILHQLASEVDCKVV